VLRAGECGNAVDEKEGHAVQSSLLCFSFLFEHLFKSFVAFENRLKSVADKPASEAIWVSTSFFPMSRPSVK
jgi:hypothetical protein